ncbi:MAG TPA: curli-like amyloid fiber formation chaperone CsgH [Bradyrhizobium sp.]|uniref:curli-like amyloid fiber formation chaperone CsgH n=1 Tax=Bradyrhizobium sp. TaxID=376 RepID=UPI002D7F23D3|nr:curli-like amyloid fiber formation chaperone CsgH [Bradyrhizobium sp.]HET7889766.1 curli-like amyloid fiber formation chaperone CsgH [Bradyrhizobium sp.]
MPDARTALISRIAIAILGVVGCCARSDAALADVERMQVKQVLAIGCRIRVMVEGEALRIEAVAQASEEASGTYRLDIQKRSTSGTSHNIQSGEFSLEADREEVLSTTFLGASDEGHFQASLLIDSNSGSVSCISP